MQIKPADESTRQRWASTDELREALDQINQKASEPSKVTNPWASARQVPKSSTFDGFNSSFNTAEVINTTRGLESINLAHTDSVWNEVPSKTLPNDQSLSTRPNTTTNFIKPSYTGGSAASEKYARSV